MKKFIKNNYYYLFVFLFVFLIYSIFCFPNNYGDPMSNYGFSYAILRGEIPYIHFNMISTPLYAYVMSLGLLFWNNYTMFLLEQAILVTIIFYLLNQLYGKKAFILLLFIVLFLGYGINATYNFFAFFFLVILLYIEKKHPDKDTLIGVVLGLAILSKHTIGGLFLLPGLLFYIKDKEKVFRRFISLCGVGVIFILYLLLTGSFVQFFDLCFFGLFDFSSSNGHFFHSWFIISILFFLLSLFITIKNKKEISNWYLLCGFSIVIPLFDVCHFSLYLLCIVIQLLPYLKKRENYFTIMSVLLSLFLIIFTFIQYRTVFQPLFNKKIPHFEYILNGKKNYQKTLEYYDFLDQYPDALILSYAKMGYDISRDKDIDYYDVFMYGNYGYHGNQKMIEKIKKLHNKMIIVDRSAYLEEKEDSQFNKDIVKYVINHSKKIDSKYIFDIYWKE